MNEDQNTTGALWGVGEDVYDSLSNLNYNKQVNFRPTAFITWKTKIKIFDCGLLAWRVSNVALVNMNILYSKVLLEKSIY